MLVLKDLQGGGAERMVLALAKGIKEAGYDTELVLFQKEGDLVDTVPLGLKIHDLNRARSREALWSLVAHLQKCRPTLILTTLHHTATIVALARRLARSDSKLVIREANHLGKLRTANSSFKGRFSNYLLRQAYRSADLLVAVSSDLSVQLRDFTGPAGPPVVTRYNPVVSESFFECAASPATLHPWLQEKRASDTPVIVAAGRLVEQKDFAMLLESMRLLQRRLSSRLLIFGEGPQRDYLEELVSALGLTGRVELPGFEHNLPAALARADAFVLSSRWEGLPGVLIQAMALQVPSVATDCPTGPREIIHRPDWGRLVPVGDSRQLAAALHDALTGRVPPAPPVAVEQFEETVALSHYIADLDSLILDAHE